MKDERRSGRFGRPALSRRDFLRRTALVSASGLLWACAPTPPATAPAPAKPAETKPAGSGRDDGPGSTSRCGAGHQRTRRQAGRSGEAGRRRPLPPSRPAP